MHDTGLSRIRLRCLFPSGPAVITQFAELKADPGAPPFPGRGGNPPPEAIESVDDIFRYADRIIVAIQRIDGVGNAR